MPRLLGAYIEMVGYTPETVIAENGVTILERGITSTRWRDYIDIVQLSETNHVDPDLLLESSRAVVTYRGMTLEPIIEYIQGYGDVGQAKWAAWRRKQNVEDISAEFLDDQVAHLSRLIDPVFARGPADPRPEEQQESGAGQAHGHAEKQRPAAEDT